MDGDAFLDTSYDEDDDNDSDFDDDDDDTDNFYDDEGEV